MDTESTVTSMEDFQKGMRLFKRVVLGVVVVLLAMVGWWAYRHFVIPGGKVTWTWPRKLERNARILSVADGHALVLNGGSLYVIDPLAGKEVRELPLAVAGYNPITVLQDGYLVETDTELVCVEADGKIRWKVPQPTDYQSSKLSSDEKGLLFFTQEPHPFNGMLAALYEAEETNNQKALAELQAKMEKARGFVPKDSLGVMDMADGKVLWQTPWPAGVSLGEMAATSTAVLAVMSRQGKDETMQHRLVAFALRTGELLDWKAPLEDVPEWGPVALGELFLVQHRSNLLTAIDANGDERFKISLPQTEDSPRLEVIGDLLVACYDTGTLAFDLQTGKGAWTLPVESHPDSVVVTAKTVYVQGAKLVDSGADIMSMPGFNQHPDMLREMGLDKAASKKSVSVLVALDRASGKVRWQVEHYTGTLCADDERVALITDTSGMGGITAMLSGGQKSDTVLRQFNVKTGKTLFEGVTQDLGIRNARLVGSRVVALTWVPAEAVADGAADRPTLVAFRLR